MEATFDPLPFDASCARAYGRVYAAISGAGRKPRGRRAVDLLIAATAIANDLPLYTCNAEDLQGLEPMLDIVEALVADGEVTAGEALKHPLRRFPVTGELSASQAVEDDRAER